MPIRERLILENALAPFVANGAIQWVVSQDEFQCRLARGASPVTVVMHHQTVSHRRGARSDQAVTARGFYLHQTLAACSYRFQTGMVAEGGNVNAHHFRGTCEHDTLWHTIFLTIDSDSNEFGHGRPIIR